ncbi:MAG: hypothetical protein R3D00_03745 [Bacteroidia bacterium]
MGNLIDHHFHLESAILSLSGEVDALKSFTIFNHLDKVVLSKELDGKNVDFSGLPEGLYKTDFFDGSGNILLSVKIFKESTQNFF